MHFYQQTKITATAAFETGRATEVGAAEGSRCVAVLCHPWTQPAFPRNRLNGQKVKNHNKSAISHRQSNQGVTEHNVNVPAQTVSPTDSQSVPWSAAAETNTAVRRALTIQTDLHILISPKSSDFQLKNYLDFSCYFSF